MRIDASYVESLVLYSARTANVLPLTSTCNVRCIFCSNRQNPPGLEVYTIRPLSKEQVRQALEFITEDEPVVIGESATRIVEGEPFTHPEIDEILSLIRYRLPRTPVKITTNGTLLNEKRVDLLAGLGGITVNLSLNSARVDVRRRVMNDHLAARAVRSAVLLGRAGIPFHGSLVALPHLTGWEDLAATVEYLAECGALTVRVFLPGFTRLASRDLKFDLSLWQQLYEFVAHLCEKPQMPPITCEPPRISSLKAEILGVMRDSAAERCGLRAGDVVLAVNGKVPRSRVEAFQMMKGSSSPQLLVERGGNKLSLRLNKKKGSAPGVVMEYDLEPGAVTRAIALAGKYGRALVLTSSPAVSVLRLALGGLDFQTAELDILEVENRFFGGSIMAAGLLTVSDLVESATAYLTSGAGRRPGVLMVPGVAFDHRGRDLVGRSYLELQEVTGVPVELV